MLPGSTRTRSAGPTGWKEDTNPLHSSDGYGDRLQQVVGEVWERGAGGRSPLMTR